MKKKILPIDNLVSFSGMAAHAQSTVDSVISVFLQLMQEVPYFDISVLDIAEKSGVSRVTFYKHFVDKEDLLWKAFRQTFLPIDRQIERVDPETLLSDGKPITFYVFENINRHRKFYRNLFMNGMPYYFQCQFLDYITSESFRTHENLRLAYGQREIDYRRINEYLAGALFNLLRNLLQEDQEINALLMGEFFTRLSGPGVINLCRKID